MGSEGLVISAFQFSMGSGTDEISGLIMPWRTPDELRNKAHTLILQEDVSEMLEILLIFASDDERVQHFAEKYKKLVNDGNALPLAA